jgi:hypothetical protein
MKKLMEALSGAVIVAACVFLRPLLRPWYSSWGATSAEINNAYPGDEYAPNPKGGYTQAIEIRAPSSSIWPWLVQIGQDKGGFYSYELLENIIGCNIHNVTRILVGCQDIKVGDNLIMHPKAPLVPVAIVEPGKTLAYGGRQDKYTANIWIFSLNQEKESTRLISRWLFEYKNNIGNKLIYNWFIEPIGAVMQRKMLMTIKKLVELNAF